MISAAALALSLPLPVGGDPLSTLSIRCWVLLLVAVAITVHLANRYGIVKNLSGRTELAAGSQ